MALKIDLSGKVVLITGVSSGIGKSIAQIFAEAGADVAGCATAHIDEAFTGLAEGYGVRTLYVQCDVTKEPDLQKLVNETVNYFGRIDILVSNAGRNVFMGAENCSEEDWLLNDSLNLRSHWLLAKLCKPYLESGGNGVIIVMGSNHAFRTIPGCFPYNITKTALTGLVRSLAIEWGPSIRTVGIAPGFVDTPGNQKWFDSFPNPQGERQRTIDLHPVKKIGSPLDVGAWCVFLASAYSSFASGTTYLLDGGRSALMEDS